MDEILNYHLSLSGTGEPFVVSGLYDLRSAFSVIDDHYRGHVRLEWLPLDITDHHTLWREYNGQRQFGPSVILPTFVQQDKRSWKRAATGEEATQNATMVLSVADLWRAAYLPKVGDQVRYRNTRYEVLTASVIPEHYWQNTGFPLYWTCEMGIAPQDSRFTECGSDPTVEPGAPSSQEPMGVLGGSTGEVTASGEPL